MCADLTLKDIIQNGAAIFQGLGSFSIVVAILIYRHQRRTILESEKQANRSRLTEAYMNVHANIIRNEENIQVSSEMIRRGHGIIKSIDGPKSPEITRAIEILYLHLNAIFLEWNYRRTYELPLPDFYKTVDNFLVGLATNPDKNYIEIVEKFALIFGDFPSEFIGEVDNRLKYLRRHSAENLS